MAVHVLSNAYRQPAKCVVRLGSAREEMPGLYSLLTEVNVDSRRNEGTVASLKLNPPRWERAWQSLRRNDCMAADQPILIHADFGNRQEEIMRGHIRDIKTESDEDHEEASVTLECLDESLPLRQTRAHRVWGGDGVVNDRFIAATILGEHGLQLDPASGSGSSCLVVVQNGTDHQFLQQRAAANGYELLFKRGTVYFGPMRLDAQPQYSIVVHQGITAHCRDFSLYSVDPSLDEASLYQAEGELESPRYGHVLRVGEPVAVDALGEYYGGVYYVDTVFHRFTPDGYRQSFNMLRHFDESGVYDVTVKPHHSRGPLFDVL